MCENYDLYLRSMSKEELIEYFYFVTNNHRNLFDKSTLENIKLEKQVDCLKQEMEEKNTYEEKLNSMIDNLRDDISEQKAEIEQLTNELKVMERDLTAESRNYEDTKIVADLLKGENVELQKQIEKLTEERDNFKKSCFTWSEVHRSNHLKFAVTEAELKGEKEKNSELQKQVEKLTEERDKAKCDNTSLLYNVSRVEKENYKLRNQVDELKSVLADTIKRNEELIEENGQSVKGTAKEICVLISGFGIDAMLEAIRETYGVEME